MKVNELMIGDWVKISHLNKIGKVYRIDRANGEGNGFAAVIDGDYYEGNLEPIPLTPEILEKNGFRIIFEGDLHVSYFQDIESFHTEVKVDKIGIYQKLSMLDGLGNRVTIVECKYVHQLQHALKLCGIEKEIKL